MWFGAQSNQGRFRKTKKIKQPKLYFACDLVLSPIKADLEERKKKKKKSTSSENLTRKEIL